MNKYEITILEQSTGELYSEVIDSDLFPIVQQPLHYLISGRCGYCMSVVRVLKSQPENVIDLTDSGTSQGTDNV